jgi:hypothetical protein
VRFAERLRTGQSQISLARFFAARIYNISPMASARAIAEYVGPQSQGGRVYRATDVVRGRGPWQNTGDNGLGTVPGTPVSEMHPSWFVLGWKEPFPIAGMFLRDSFQDFCIDSFSGPADKDPQIAIEEEWRAVGRRMTNQAPASGDAVRANPPSDPADDDTQAAFEDERTPAARLAIAQTPAFAGRWDTGRWVTFPNPLKTTGLRLRILKTSPPKIAGIESLLVLADLGDQPIPQAHAIESPAALPGISYTTAEAGTVTLVVDDPAGVRVRNLTARAERKAGDNTEYWDLRNEAGRYVPPGIYRWKGISAPPLQLRYELTVYPNVSQLHTENSAWFNAWSGSGGWLADHSAPFGGCASGDRLFFGAPCAESGVSLVCCDTTGRKQWAIQSFDAWTGARRMASDSQHVYVENGCSPQGYPLDRDHVWVIDPEKRSCRPLLQVNGTEKRRRGIVGMAARDGKLVISVRAQENHLARTGNAALVDVEQCRPSYPPPRKPKFPYEVVPDPRNDFLRLFRLTGSPAGSRPWRGLNYLEAADIPGHRPHILLTFKEPVAIGSCVFPVPPNRPYTVKLSVAKPDAPYPPDPAKRDHWIPFERDGSLPWDVVAAPPNTLTHALRIQFEGDEQAIETDMAEPEAGAGDRAPNGDGTSADRPGAARIEGMTLLRRRFTNLFATATVRVSSGTIAADGAWDAQRTEPLRTANPAVYTMEWKTPQPVRGLAIREIDGRFTEIDAWAADGTPDPQADRGWQKLARYEQTLRYYYQPDGNNNAEARYVDGYVDFGREVNTRALRLRVVEQWLYREADRSGCVGVRLDQGGRELTPARCRIYGVAPLAYLGGEPPVDPLACERIEIVDVASGKLEREIAVSSPGDLAFAPDGALHAVSGNRIVRVNLAGGEHSPTISDLVRPGPVACDVQGNLYVYDHAEDRKNVRVYDPAGKFQRTIGDPGGFQTGPWNPNRMDNVTALAVDREGKLWTVEQNWFPKRISCRRLDGTFLREYLGPTQYGGAGVLDPCDRRRLFYGPMEFEIDWDNGTSRLKNMTRPAEGGDNDGEVPIRVNNRTYLVNRSTVVPMTCARIYLYENDRLRLVAALGLANDFASLRRPDVLLRLGATPLTSLQFAWSDANGDGKAQYEECQFEPKTIRGFTPFKRDLSIQAGACTYEVKEFLPNGAPVYAVKKLPLPITEAHGDGIVYRLDNGLYYRFGVSHPETAWTADGKTVWTYKQDGASTGGRPNAGQYRPDQVVGQYGIVGHETAPEGDLGEFYVINSDYSSWYLWTSDGLLAGRIFRDIRDPGSLSWNMHEHDRGLALDDVAPHGEHFSGWFCRADDGRYYAVAGKEHASIVEVRGMEKFKRFGGELTITPEDIRRTHEWEKERAKSNARESARVYDCYLTDRGIEVDGAIGDWDGIPSLEIEQPQGAPPGRSIAFRMCRNASTLYLLYEARGAGPLKNTGEQWDRLFKSGACVDLMIAADDKAAPNRRAPVRGDMRLLMTALGKKPVAVLYDPVNPDAPKEQKWEAVSPTDRVHFDSVRQLSDFRFCSEVLWHGDAVNTSWPVGYRVEAGLPLKSLGLTAKTQTCVKMDWGILETDDEGAVVLRRTYWANKAASALTLSDVPTEARLEPDMWGYVRFCGVLPEALGGPRIDGAGELLKPDGSGAAVEPEE